MRERPRMFQSCGISGKASGTLFSTISSARSSQPAKRAEPQKTKTPYYIKMLSKFKCRTLVQLGTGVHKKLRDNGGLFSWGRRLLAARSDKTCDSRLFVLKTPRKP